MAVVTVDFDGTLFRGNSFNVMFQVAKKDFSIKEWTVVFAGMVKAVCKGLLKGKQAFRQQFFKAFAKSFKGKTKQELESFFQQLVNTGREEVHRDLVARIREHQQQGDFVILLSGALLPFLHAFIKELQLDVHVIGTELLYDEQGNCTGEINTMINGDEKVRKVKEWMENSETSAKSEQEIWAYADSDSDIPLFRFADHPIVVNPNPAMKKIAEQNNWPIFA
ncbi:haloacid dehalogenase [Virgibacillus profundi]|uniref:Haloacid dehalogenase n=1 Tax=Virgibacillus profundi TaxID=2024555 RepID=A0A2A2IHF6_9BACI|nr:HAD family hydrolase [Virgibacillus profundi]PAV30808.1 haloacid dehalogenase [Virgibacillus profundi]PXY54991.1 HAD-IB family hydrolase [Virgibacillus profundi]